MPDRDRPFSNSTLSLKAFEISWPVARALQTSETYLARAASRLADAMGYGSKSPFPTP